MVTAFLCLTSELLLMNFWLDYQLTKRTLKHQELDVKVHLAFLHKLISKDAIQAFLIPNNTCFNNPLLTQGIEPTAFVAELWNIVI